jgi:hypothetical protein
MSSNTFELVVGTKISARFDPEVGRWASVVVNGKDLEILGHFDKARLDDCQLRTEYTPAVTSCSSNGNTGVVTGTVAEYDGAYPAEAQTFAFKNDTFIDAASEVIIQEAATVFLHPQRRALYLPKNVGE